MFTLKICLKKWTEIRSLFQAVWFLDDMNTYAVLMENEVNHCTLLLHTGLYAWILPWRRFKNCCSKTSLPLCQNCNIVVSVRGLINEKKKTRIFGCSVTATCKWLKLKRLLFLVYVLQCLFSRITETSGTLFGERSSLWWQTLLLLGPAACYLTDHCTDGCIFIPNSGLRCGGK